MIGIIIGILILRPLKSHDHKTLHLRKSQQPKPLHPDRRSGADLEECNDVGETPLQPSHDWAMNFCFSKCGLRV